MSTSESHYINTANTRLHGAWMWHKSAEANSWTPVWSVLRDNILFFFTSEITSMENHIGTLQLGKDSKFSYGQSDPKDGYKFELLIGKKRKKFRVKTSYERELWRAYMEGVITGSVPAGILSPQDTAAINQKLRRVHQLVSPASSTSAAQLPRPSLSAAAAAPSHSASSPVLPVDRGDTTSIRTSTSFSSASPRRPSLPSVGSTGTGSSSGTELDPPNMVTFTVREPSQRSADSGRASDYFGGPVMRHKFADDKMPSWFFSDCSRELAEKILNSCHQQGNTLMRVSWTARDTGSYAISKRMARSGHVAHYEVIRVAEGYKINVENCNTAMKTLNQVMEFFIQLSGQAVTHPMTSNNLEKLGIDYTDYSRRIIIQEDNSAQAENDSDDGDNYEVPEESARKVASAPPPPPSFAPPLSAQHPSPLSFAPPPSAQPPPPPSFPPPPSAQPGAKVQHKTWSKVKTDETKRQIQVGAALPKTLGPADRKQAKPDSAKPSVMQLNQTLQEQSVVENLDAVLRKEETRAVHRGSSSDIPPPLPAVPANRKKLTTDSQAVYVNAASQAATVAESETDSHPRWNKRSQSVPAISNQGLDVQVPAHVVPPSVVKPSWAKTAPPTAPKTTRPLQKSVSQDIPHSSAPGVQVPNMIQELQQKLQMGTPQLKPTRVREAGSAAPTALMSHQSQPADSGNIQEEGEEYEDISQYYQNVSP